MNSKKLIPGEPTLRIRLGDHPVEVLRVQRQQGTVLDLDQLQNVLGLQHPLRVPVQLLEQLLDLFEVLDLESGHSHRYSSDSFFIFSLLKGNRYGIICIPSLSHYLSRILPSSYPVSISKGPFIPRFVGLNLISLVSDCSVRGS